MLHDSLLEIDRLDQFERVYGRAVAAGHAGVVASFAVGGLLAGAKGFGLPLALSVAGPWLGAVVVAKAMSDPPRCSFGPAVPRRYLDTVRAGLAEVRSSSVLLHVVGIGATVACVWGAAEELVPVYLAEKERFSRFDRSYPGVYVGRECRRTGLRPSASGAFRGCDLSSFALASGLLLASVAADGVLAFGLLVASAGTNGSGAVLLAGHLQRSIRGPARATVTSVLNMGQEVGGIVLYLSLGSIASVTSWHAGIGVVCAVAVALCAGFLIIPAKRGTR